MAGSKAANGPKGENGNSIGTSTHAQKILLLTGLSGAGKSTALRALEDMGWEVMDNFPIRLLSRLLATPPSSVTEEADAGDTAEVLEAIDPALSKIISPENAASAISLETDASAVSPETGASAAHPHAHSEINPPLAIGFDSRTRGFSPHTIMAQISALNSRADLSISSLFLDCSEQELERRYNETRRRHPVAHDHPLAVGITQERELLAPLKRAADAVLDTTGFSTHDLQQSIRTLFEEPSAQAMSVTVTSFGFAKGMPPIADLLFDMRFLGNPFWIPNLQKLSGLDQPVADHIREDPSFAPVFAQIKATVELLLPLYAKQGKAYVTVAFGCTGGQHRSVFTASEMAKSLMAAGYHPNIVHRDLGSSSAALVEDNQKH